VVALPQGPKLSLVQHAWAGPRAGGAPLPVVPCAVCSERLQHCCRCQEGPLALWPWLPPAARRARSFECPGAKSGDARSALSTQARMALGYCEPASSVRHTQALQCMAELCRAACRALSPLPTLRSVAWSRLRGAGSVRPAGAPAASVGILVAPCLGGGRPARPEAGRSGRAVEHVYHTLSVAHQWGGAWSTGHMQPRATCFCRLQSAPSFMRDALRQVLGVSARNRASSALPATGARCAFRAPQTRTVPCMQGAATLQSRQCDQLRCCNAVWLRTVLPNGACSGCCTAPTRNSL